MNPTTIIVNPAAGSGRAHRQWAKIADEAVQLASERGQTLHAVYSEEPGDAVIKAREACEHGSQRILGFGGDGTIHEIVNGIPPDWNGELGILPGGTGNDFSLNLGIPQDPKAALPIALGSTVRQMDLGEVDGIRFVNIAGAGFDAEVAAYVNRVGKRMGGMLPYVWGVLRQLVGYESMPVSVWVDGQQVFAGRSLLVAVGIAPAYGGGLRLLPGARLSDGLFDVGIFGDLSRVEVLTTLPKVVTGAHLDHPKVTVFHGKEVKIELEQESRHASLHADGEAVGSLPGLFRILPGTLSVLCP